MNITPGTATSAGMFIFLCILLLTDTFTDFFVSQLVQDTHPNTCDISLLYLSFIVAVVVWGTAGCAERAYSWLSTQGLFLVVLPVPYVVPRIKTE